MNKNRNDYNTMKLYITCEYGTKETSTNFVGVDFEVNLDKDELAFVHKILSVDRDLRDNFYLLKNHAPQLYWKTCYFISTGNNYN